MNLFVFGGNRFMGKSLVKELMRLNFNVTIFNRSGTGPTGANIIQGDRNNLKDIKKINFKEYDYIFDMCLFKPKQYKLIEKYLVESNLKKYIFISSAAVNNKFAGDQVASLYFCNDYALEKERVENLIKKTKLNYTIIRPVYVVGEDNHRPRLSYFINKILNDRPIPIKGKGDNLINLVHISDVVELIKASMYTYDRETLIASNGQNLSINDIITKISEFLNTKEFTIINEPNNTFNNSDFVFDKTQDSFKELEDMLPNYYEWLKTKGNKLNRSKPYIPQEDKEFILSEWKNVLDTGMFVQGKNVEKLEKIVAEYCNVKHAIATSSGGTALEVALMSTKIKNKKFIICTQTFIVSINAIIRSGNVPVIVDMDEKSQGLTADIINKHIDSDTAGVMLVHMAGHITSDYKEIRELCKQNNLLLIEDAAHAIGASIEGNKAGSISDISCFSFFPTKIITTGEGGIITTNNDEMAEQARIIRNYGCKDYRSECTYISNNFKMQELSAVLGISQMQRIDEFINKRNILADRYYDNLRDVVHCPNEYVLESQIHTWWHYMIVIDKDFDRTELVDRLLEKGIPTATAYNPACHEQSIFKEYLIDKYPVADDILNRHLALPLHVEMTLDQVDFVCDSIKKIYNK